MHISILFSVFIHIIFVLLVDLPWNINKILFIKSMW